MTTVLLDLRQVYIAVIFKNNKEQLSMKNVSGIKGIVVAFFICCSWISVDAQKITAEELVEKHIQSIGKIEDIAQIKSRVLVGSGRINSRLSAITPDTGAVQFGSQNGKTVFAMIFNYVDYPYEKAAFDGEKISVGIPKGRRTPVAEFLRSQTVVLKQGLFGGALNSAWPLLKLKENNIKVEYAGKGEWGDVPSHKLKFLTKTGGVSVVLFFDVTNFHHIGSEYKFTIPPRQGGMTTNSSQMPSYYTLTETFGNFKLAGKITLPLAYKLTIDNTGSTAASIAQGTQEWNIEYSDVYFDQDLSADLFRVS
jgi:hypothetical protein